MISPEIIEDLKYRNPIEDVISSYVELRRAGSNLKGLCPFHSEKTPSFTVYSADGHYYCYGCGSGGDVITFIMKMEGLDYRSALEFLAKRCGITLPDDEDRSPRGVSRARVLEMNVCAARFFRDCLYDEALGAPGREYLAKRQLSPSIVRHFGLGYAPDSFTALRDHLRQAGYSDDEMVEGYFCGKSRKNGSLYDYFRGRLMFPIIDVSGNIIAFGGRVLDDSKPKYLNSSDTPAFKKSRNLFALNYAKSHCSDCLILCEGYMDVIALHSAGFENAVATLGTAITPDHARLMKKYSSKCIISYDSDGAGQNATEKALRLLDEAGVEARVLKVTGAKDPDEFIRLYGGEKFKELITGSRTVMDHKIDSVKARYDISTDDGKLKAARELCEDASRVYSKVQQDIYISKIAAALEIDQKSVRYDTQRAAKRRIAGEKKGERDELIRKGIGIGDRVNPDFGRNPKAAKAEEAVLALLMCRKENASAVLKEKMLSSDDFVTDYGRRLFEFISATADYGGFEIGAMGESFTEAEISRAEYLINLRRNLSDNGIAVLKTCIAALKKEKEGIRMKESGDVLDIINKKRAASGVSSADDEN